MRTYDRALLEAVLLASFVGAPMSITASTQEEPATTPTERESGCYGSLEWLDSSPQSAHLKWN